MGLKHIINWSLCLGIPSKTQRITREVAMTIKLNSVEKP